MNINKKLLSIGGAIVVLVAVTVSWAFYSSSHTVDNAMNTGKYGDVLTEVFTPDKNWEPGEEATKEVGITNTGNYDLYVRVKMSESWTYQDDQASEEVVPFITHTSADAKFNPKSGAPADDLQVNPTDGLTAEDGSVVYKQISLAPTVADEEQGIAATAGWAYAADGYWYYKTPLAPGQSTGNLLESITLCKNTDMGTYANNTRYAVTTSKTAPQADDAAWLTLGEGQELTDVVVNENEFLHVYNMSSWNEETGYAGADYVLTITGETCQATREAVDAMFAGGESFVEPEGVDWNLSNDVA